jgi:prolyl 4-hydroxylase
MLDVETRCPLDPDAMDALYPGDLHKMFERVAYAPEFQELEPVVVSKPPEGPWMILFENAISDLEADQLIALGSDLGYERSADVGTKKLDGTYTNHISTGRTSTNAWCVKECMDDPILQRVTARIATITGIPEPNSENLQLLRYQKDQFYQTHSDYIPYQRERPSGVT